MDFITVAVDVGSTSNGNFGYARVDTAPEPGVTHRGADIQTCVEVVADALASELPVALGIEAPCWLPVPRSASDVGRGRAGEGNRSCFASAGSAVASLGMHQLAWMLQAVGELHSGPVAVTTRPDTWAADRLLLWEAFVSGSAHATKADADPHVRDAATAAMGFVDVYRNGRRSAVTLRADEQAFSLIGAVLGWARAAGHVLVDEADILAEPIVVKPGKYEGPIG